MRVILQRVSQAAVHVDGATVGEIGPGLLLLAGFEACDNASDLDWMAGKIVRMRLFPDQVGVMNRSVQDIHGDILAVSQFTLYASIKKGNRPGWSRAAPGEISSPLFDEFARKLSELTGKSVPTGVFGADMQITLINDGPVSLFIDSRQPE